jgi:tRNA A37 threonylcarbamoyladenosine modification protein TsaB
VVSTDARRGEIYWARYSAAGMRIVGPQVTNAGVFDVPVVADQPVDTAEMASRVAELLDGGSQPVSLTGEWAPHGTDGSSLAIPSGPLFAPRPLYLRSPDITWSPALLGSGNK